MADIIRSAIFVDFDNMFSSVFEHDHALAMKMASDPSSWLDPLLKRGLLPKERRMFCSQRAYLNPEGALLAGNYGNNNGTLYIQRFRPQLVDAGFEVIDCAPITSHGKNASDIRMVVDAMLMLVESCIPCDEFIICSQDADFTPLLQVLRTRGIHTVIVAPDFISSGYHAVANDVVRHKELYAWLGGQTCTPSEPKLRESIPRTPTPIRIPNLPRSVWSMLFLTLIEYRTLYDFRLSHCTAWTRDRLHELGFPVGRQTIGRVVKGILLGGVSLRDDTDATPQMLCDAYRKSLMYQYETANLDEPTAKQILATISDIVAVTSDMTD